MQLLLRSGSFYTSCCPLVDNDDFLFFQYDNIDSAHKAIFECIFNCAKDPSNAGLLTKLYQVTDDHFKDEEVSHVYIINSSPGFYI